MTDKWFGSASSGLAGRMQEQKVFFSEEQAREFARQAEGVAPDLVLKIEPMPIQHVWN